MGSEKATPRTRAPNASCSHAPPASPTSGVGTSPLDAAVLRDALPGVLGVRRSPAGLKLCRRRHRALLGAGLEPGPGGLRFTHTSLGSENAPPPPPPAALITPDRLPRHGAPVGLLLPRVPPRPLCPCLGQQTAFSTQVCAALGSSAVHRKLAFSYDHGHGTHTLGDKKAEGKHRLRSVPKLNKQ